MTDEEKAKYLPQIDATLKYGKFEGNKLKLILILSIIFSLITIAGMALLLTYLCIDFKSNHYDTVKFIFAIMGTVFGFSLIPIILFFESLKFIKINKEVNLWLNDAVCTGAHSYVYSKSDAGSSPFPSYIYKIKINFKMDGKHISSLSKDKNIDFSLPNGYSLFWKKYDDKGIKILYSPKYEEVMILKEPKNK